MPVFSAPERLPKSRVRCVVTFDERETAEAEHRALQALGKDMRVKGFRPGHIPSPVIKERVNPDQLFEVLARELLKSALPELIRTNDLHPILPPRVSAESRSPVTLAVTIIERPEVKWKKKGPPSVSKKEVTVDPKEIEGLLDHTLRQYETASPVDRAAKEGDKVTIDFSGKDAEGKEITGTVAENFDVTIGSKSLIPGFEEELIGKKTGDEHTFTVTFPKEYHAEQLREKPVTFTIRMRGVSEVQKPELTDAFATEKLSLPSAAAVREAAESTIRSHHESAERMRREREFLEALAEAVDADLAEELVEEEAMNMFEQHAQRLQQQGMNIDDWFARAGKKPEEFQKELLTSADKRIRTRLGLQHMLHEKQIDLTDDEIAAMIEEAAAVLDTNDLDALTELRSRQGNAYEQAIWQRKIEKMLEELLK